MIGRSVLRHGGGALPIDAGVPAAAPRLDAGPDAALIDAAGGAIDASAGETNAAAAKPDSVTLLALARRRRATTLRS